MESNYARHHEGYEDETDLSQSYHDLYILKQQKVAPKDLGNFSQLTYYMHMLQTVVKKKKNRPCLSICKAKNKIIEKTGEGRGEGEDLNSSLRAK